MLELGFFIKKSFRANMAVYGPSSDLVPHLVMMLDNYSISMYHRKYNIT